ncbi:hypothetical protein DAPK24_020820 [Pichia kluyveri]|uniref:Uncharacterized protein n=1 Tax=Pichia kluyveri TaxID=36015 RepID=A0AAV5R3C9_PICKL|nr:hypothetical protein DAPK24_020820 [Pichia kluyveri]
MFDSKQFIYNKNKPNNDLMSFHKDKFKDPLLELLQSDDLNKNKELSDSLITYIDDISDEGIKLWCIESLTLLRDLENLENNLSKWEFLALDHTIQLEIENNRKGINNNARQAGISLKEVIVLSNRSNMKKATADEVLNQSEKIKSLLLDNKVKIDESIERAKKVSKNARLLISDAGTIMVKLTMRIVKLAKYLDQQVNIGYSKAKLIKIGIDVETILIENNELLEGFNFDGYRDYINETLDDIFNAVTKNNTKLLWNALRKFNTAEKTFEKLLQKSKSKLKHKHKHKHKNKHKHSHTHSDDDSHKIKHKHKHKHIEKSDEKNSSSDKISVSSPTLSEVKSKNLSDVDSSKTLVNGGDYQDNTNKNVLTKISARETFKDDDSLLRSNIGNYMPELLAKFKKGDDISGNSEDESKDEKIETQDSSSEKAKSEIIIDDKHVKPPSLITNLWSSFYQPVVFHNSNIPLKETKTIEYNNEIDDDDDDDVENNKATEKNSIKLIENDVNSDDNKLTEKNSNKLIELVELQALETKVKLSESTMQLNEMENNLEKQESTFKKPTVSEMPRLANLLNHRPITGTSGKILNILNNK